MSDSDVARLLRSDAPLVVTEAPAGCGKTYQGAEYAKDCAAADLCGRVLILAHTHAACGVFRDRTQGAGNKVEVKTMASLAVEIASAYHIPLELPHQVETWARMGGEGSFEEVAKKCASYLIRHPMIARALARRYPIVICDEHQDCTADQHVILMGLHGGGAKLRVFADPLQRIYTGKTLKDSKADAVRWEALRAQGVHAVLDYPHRWKSGSIELGKWVLSARTALMKGHPIIVPAKRPSGLNIIVADNQAKTRGQLHFDNRRTIDDIMMSGDQMLILTSSNKMADAITAFTNRRVGIWEGHTRDALTAFVGVLQSKNGDAEAIVSALVDFVAGVGVGFSMSTHGTRLMQEVKEGCCKRTKGKPSYIQDMAKAILTEPNHIGASKALGLLKGFIEQKQNGFDTVKIDYRAEFGEAIRLGSFPTPEEGLGEMMRRRAHFRHGLPDRIVSTIHKAKGLECRNAMLIPCDSVFSSTYYSRCRLYVALSRASNGLTLVVPSSGGSPLIKFE
jgi:DNA helicase-2/ATP-dependent DNA helicase PcrA